MNNREIAAILFNISVILSRQHANPYRIRAYRRAARQLLGQREQVATRLAAGKSTGIPGLGQSLNAKISRLAVHGDLPFYEQLVAELSPAEQALIKVPGLGARLAERISRDLETPDLASLRRAVESRRIEQVFGVGPQRSAAIRAALAGAPRVRQEALGI